MSDLVVETSGLRKVYRHGLRRTVALDGLDLQVPAGGVHGFLGPNGSGKTTTLRILLGLARPSGGSVRVLGAQVPRHLPQVVDRVSGVVDQAGFVPRLSGRKNLALVGRSLGVKKAAVDEVLHQVGLQDRARSSYASYSLGMRQRLAIAAALLKTPDLLLLDEATTGLGPAGTRSVRDLVRRLGDSGVTVLLSSHNLVEVQELCHSVSIVQRGRLVASGRVEDLLGEDTSRTRVVVADLRGAEHLLRGEGHTVTRADDHLLVEGHARPEAITQALARRGHYVSELTEARPDLETYFLRLTGRSASSNLDVGDRADEGADDRQGAAS
ncbi:ABC transporter ATP-binding protein [Nocardioides marmoraquaticus]